MRKSDIASFPARLALALLLLVMLFIGQACSTLLAPAQPQDGSQQLFEGVSYKREVRSEPRAMVIHIVTVDLKAEGIKTLVTPGDPQAERPLEAHTTSDFLEGYGLQLAVNGDGFEPWRDLGPLDYYPKTGDRVSPTGFAASNGTIYSQDTDEEPTLYIYKTNKASISSLVGQVYNAVSGNLLLVQRGQPLPDLDNRKSDPRTAIGLDRPGRRLVIVVVDGRQEGYSEGATLAELAQILVENNAYTAINMDGGGSSTLVIEGEDGSPQVLNSPIHQGIPGNERPVGNHLGISARRK